MKIEKEILIGVIVVALIVWMVFVFNERKLKREQKDLQEQVEEIIDDAIKKHEIEIEQLYDSLGALQISGQYLEKEINRLTIEIYGKDTTYTIDVPAVNKSGKRANKKRYFNF